MMEQNWSKKEKAIAKRAFENAYEKECKDLIEKIQKRASVAKGLPDIWRLHEFLSKKIKEIKEIPEKIKKLDEEIKKNLESIGFIS